MNTTTMNNMSCILTNLTTNVNTPIPCNDLVGSDNLLGGGVAYTAYGYLVNTTAANVFLGMFIAATIVHVALGVYHRTLFTFFTLSFGAAIEAIGWGGRYWSAHTTFWDPNQGGQWDTNENGFLMQIVCLVIAPTFFSAANYILLGRLIRDTGDVYSSITAASFTVLFTAADVLCLVVQGVGGGMTGEAVTDEQTANGIHVMAAGVVLQLVLTIIFIGFLAEFITRLNRSHATRPRDFTCVYKWMYTRWSSITCKATRQVPSIEEKVPVSAGVLGGSGPTFRENVVLGALGLSTVLILGRSIFRSDELLGFSTASTTGAYYNQGLFIGMDASLMLLLLVTYAVVHPGTHVRRRFVAGAEIEMSRNTVA